MNVDWTKPIEYVDKLGRTWPAICAWQLQYAGKIVIVDPGKEETVRFAGDDGKTVNKCGVAQGTVRNVQPPPPKTHRLWLNAYWRGSHIHCHEFDNHAEAVNRCHANAIARAVPVDIPEGYGLDNPDKEQ